VTPKYPSLYVTTPLGSFLSVWYNTGLVRTPISAALRTSNIVRSLNRALVAFLTCINTCAPLAVHVSVVIRETPNQQEEAKDLLQSFEAKILKLWAGRFVWQETQVVQFPRVSCKIPATPDAVRQKDRLHMIFESILIEKRLGRAKTWEMDARFSLMQLLILTYC
jgi:hypothetical protein